MVSEVKLKKAFEGHLKATTVKNKKSLTKDESISTAEFIANSAPWRWWKHHSDEHNCWDECFFHRGQFPFASVLKILFNFLRSFFFFYKFKNSYLKAGAIIDRIMSSMASAIQAMPVKIDSRNWNFPKPSVSTASSTVNVAPCSRGPDYNY